MGGGLSRSDRNIAWIEANCRVPEGKFVGQPIKLRPFQRDVLRRIYDNPAGTRRAIISVGRKNAKTALSAFLLLLHLVGPESVPNSQLFSAAQSRDQAGILFSLAAKCVRLSATLSAYVGIRDTAKQIFCLERGTLYRALSADATTAYGLSPVFIVHDELGQVRGPRSELYEALETAVGAQEEPLSIVISTQAPNDGDLLSVLIDDAKSNDDPRVVLCLYTAPEELDPFGDEAIKAANPAFGDFQNAAEVRAMAEDARRMPARANEYRNLVLNQRVNMNAPLVSKDAWVACLGGAEIADGEDVYLGLDLSSVSDLTALVAVSADGGDRVLPLLWKPKDMVQVHATRDRVPYDVWVEQGHLLTSPGQTIAPETIARTIVALAGRFRVLGLAYDRWRMAELIKELDRLEFAAQKGEGDGLKLIEWGQGYASMAPAVDAFERSVLDHRLRHPGNPLLTWNVANAVVVSDAAGNRKLDKDKARFRIDGAVALAMALGLKARERVQDGGTDLTDFLSDFATA